MCSPKAGAGRVGSAGVRQSLTGLPSWRTVPSSGCSTSTTIPRARTSSESSASSRSRIGSMQQSCSSLKAQPLVAGAGAEDRGDLLPGLRARRLELLLDQVGTLDAVAEGGPELRLQGTAGDPAVGGLVGQVADQPAGEHAARRAAAPLRRRSSGRRPSPARRGRRRPSRRRPSAPRRSARARAAPPSPRRRPSGRRRRGRRSGRPTAPAGRPWRRSARAAPTRPR